MPPQVSSQQWAPASGVLRAACWQGCQQARDISSGFLPTVFLIFSLPLQWCLWVFSRFILSPKCSCLLRWLGTSLICFLASFYSYFCHEKFLNRWYHVKQAERKRPDSFFYIYLISLKSFLISRRVIYNTCHWKSKWVGAQFFLQHSPDLFSY